MYEHSLIDREDNPSQASNNSTSAQVTPSAGIV